MQRADVVEQLKDTVGVAVSSHQRDTGDGRTVAFDQSEEAVFSEFFSDIAPKIDAVAAGAGARAARKIDSERDLVGKLLENDVVVDVFEHK